jgi:hypothetical protein
MRPSDWIALAATGVAVASIASNAILLALQRRAAERTSRQQQAAQVLGPVLVLLVELNPQRWMFTMGPKASERAAGFNWLWENKVREQLLAIHASFPEERQRKLALDLDVALYNSIVSSTQFGITSGSDTAFTLEVAKADWEKASRLADRLAAVIRGDKVMPPESPEPSE